MSELYYTAPRDNQFEEVKEKAIEIWKTYDDSYGYSSGKINQIKDLKNIRDNFMFIVSMFDCENQRKLFNKLSIETASEISKRII